MASAINYNTVWTSIFEPLSTFGFLERYGRTNPLAKRHDLPMINISASLPGVSPEPQLGNIEAATIRTTAVPATHRVLKAFVSAGTRPLNGNTPPLRKELSLPAIRGAQQN